VEEHQSLLALLGSDGANLDGISETFGADVLPYVIKAQCLELIRLRSVVEDLGAANRNVEAMLGGLLGVSLPGPLAGEDAESRALAEEVYRVGVQLRSRIEGLERENADLRARLARTSVPPAAVGVGGAGS
jgi:hypothetical protein